MERRLVDEVVGETVEVPGDSLAGVEVVIGGPLRSSKCCGEANLRRCLLAASSGSFRKAPAADGYLTLFSPGDFERRVDFRGGASDRRQRIPGA